MFDGVGLCDCLLINDYIRDYYIDEDENIIIVNCFNGKTMSYEYTKDKEKDILELMKTQQIEMISIADEYSLDYIKKNQLSNSQKRFLIYMILYGTNSILNKTLAGKITWGIGSLWWIIAFHLSKDTSKEREIELITYFRKIKYFLDNEDIINLDIRKRNEEENQNCNVLPEPNLTTINDASKMHIKELKEIVELVCNAYPEEVKQLQKKRSY